ncbi:hypothetical protein BKG79_22200 [Mycobacteroides chelonae]|nr:hypothetical protein BKG79_22200 [Mycobacteroides chelonae]
MVLTGLLPTAGAEPNYPDVDSLIDDSGPLPRDAAELMQTSNLLFTTPSGIVCKKSVVREAPGVICAGDMPGTPPGTRAVAMHGTYDALANGPAQFLWIDPDQFFEDTRGQVPVLLPTGHKFVFWAFSSTQSFVCGVPASAALICVFKASSEYLNTAPAVTHGFVISASGSRVF